MVYFIWVWATFLFGRRKSFRPKFQSHLITIYVFNILKGAVGRRGDSNLVNNFYLARYFQRLLRFYNLKSNRVILALLKRSLLLSTDIYILSEHQKEMAVFTCRATMFLA